MDGPRRSPISSPGRRPCGWKSSPTGKRWKHSAYKRCPIMSDAASDALVQPPAAHPSGLLINRDFALLWIGQIVSSIGDFALSATLVLWIATRLAVNEPWAPLAVSGEFLALTIPVVLFGPLAGVFVDRWDKRRTMLAMDLARALLVSLLIPLAAPLGDGLSPAWLLAGLYSV